VRLRDLAREIPRTPHAGTGNGPRKRAGVRNFSWETTVVSRILRTSMRCLVRVP